MKRKCSNCKYRELNQDEQPCVDCSIGYGFTDDLDDYWEEIERNL